MTLGGKRVGVTVAPHLAPELLSPATLGEEMRYSVSFHLGDQLNLADLNDTPF